MDRNRTHLLVFQGRLLRIDPRNLLALFKYFENSCLEFARYFAQHIPLRIAAGLNPGKIRHSSDHRPVFVFVNVNNTSKHRNVGLGVTSDPK